MSAAAQLKTTCPYCGVGCGVTAQPGPDNDVIAVSGTTDHPANLGRLCVKGSALHETLSNSGRLELPVVDGRSVSWLYAIDQVAGRFKSIADKYGPDSVAFYLSGQLLTEDYYVANKLMKGFIGSANVDTNSRLCMSSAVVGYKRAFGSDTVPCSYEDLEICDLLVMVGSNAAWTHPVLYQRIAAAKQQRPEMKVVVVDTRRTATCDIADLVLTLQPGSDAWLFNGLLCYLDSNNLTDQGFIDDHTDQYEAAFSAAKSADLQTVAKHTGLCLDDLNTFFTWYGATEKTVSFYSQGINQSSSGSDKCNAIINCHLATGRIGKPGMGPFSITGQPNAMGGREVGGLANQLAAHMDFAAEDVDRVGRFWGAEKMAGKPGLKAVDLFDAIDKGKVKAVWIMATNPVVSMPNADAVRSALQRCELVVVSDCVAETDTTALADILLPTTGWGEKVGTVTNSERCISRQRALLPAYGEARHDWWILTQVARRMGFENSFPYESARDVFVEHAALSGFENDGSRDFDISGLAELSEQDYENLQPIKWPVNTSNPEGTERMFADGRFFTKTGRANFIAVVPRLPVQKTNSRFPLMLNTGRIRDQWHTMTRTGKASRLLTHIASPSLSIHPDDAAQRGLKPNQLVRVFNDLGQFHMLVDINDQMARGQVFAPMHWNSQFASDARVGVVISPNTDPFSGQPESKANPVDVAPVEVRSWIAVIAATELKLPDDLFYFRVPIKGGWRYEIACEAPRAAADLRKNWFGSAQGVLRFEDSAESDFRYLQFVDRQLQTAAFFAADREALPDRQWLAKMLQQAYTNAAWQWLSGEDDSHEDCGRLICSCYEVGEKTIIQAINRGICSVDELGASLKCGTNCGSCIPELKQLVSAQTEKGEAA